MSCFCFRRRPRYQSLIDSILSPDVEEQINEANLRQLLDLAMPSADKRTRDRIGQSLLAKLEIFVERSNIKSCQQCLRVVDNLAEQCDYHELQITTMRILLKFKDKPEDRPTYQIEYDFIIERLTSLALPANKSTEVRMEAIEQLNDLVSKVTAVQWWEEVHLNKLVPVYLYRMKEEPDDRFLRSFVGTAEITHFPRLMAAVFKHFDNNHSWISDSGFVNTVMEIVVKATEVRMVHSIVESLLNHLGKHKRNVLISTAIVQVLDKVVAMAAEGIAGPYLLDFLRTLVSHLKTNISQAHSSSENKVPLEKFQQELVKVIISCGESVPNYERWNIVCYLISQMPDVVAVETDIQLSRELMNMCSRVMKYIQTRDDAFINLVRESLETHLKALLRHLKNAIGQACSSRNKVPLEKFQQELVKVINYCGEHLPNCERWNIVGILIGQIPDNLSVDVNIQLSRELMTMCSRVMKYIQTRDDAFLNLVRESLETHLKALLRHLKNAIGQACSSRNKVSLEEFQQKLVEVIDLLKLMASELSMTISFSDKLLEYIRKNLSGVKITRWPGSTPILPENPNQAYGPQEFGLADRVGTRSLTRLDTLPP